MTNLTQNVLCNSCVRQRQGSQPERVSDDVVYAQITDVIAVVQIQHTQVGAAGGDSHNRGIGDVLTVRDVQVRQIPAVSGEGVNRSIRQDAIVCEHKLLETRALLSKNLNRRVSDGIPTLDAHKGPKLITVTGHGDDCGVGDLIRQKRVGRVDQLSQVNAASSDIHKTHTGGQHIVDQLEGL